MKRSDLENAAAFAQELTETEHKLVILNKSTPVSLSILLKDDQGIFESLEFSIEDVLKSKFFQQIQDLLNILLNDRKTEMEGLLNSLGVEVNG